MYAPCSLLILPVSRQGRCLAFPTRVYQHAPASLVSTRPAWRLSVFLLSHTQALAFMLKATAFKARSVLTRRLAGAVLTSVRTEVHPPFELPAALDPYPDANAPESVPLSESVLHVAQIALGQIFRPVREEREPRWRRACLGSVADLDPLRRRAAPYHVTDELCKLVCRYPPPVCPRYSSRERQDLVHPCTRKRRDVNGLRLEVGEAGRNEPLNLPQPSWGYEVSLVHTTPHEEPASSISRAILRSPATMLSVASTSSSETSERLMASEVRKDE